MGGLSHAVRSLYLVPRRHAGEILIGPVRRMAPVWSAPALTGWQSTLCPPVTMSITLDDHRAQVPHSDVKADYHNGCHCQWNGVQRLKSRSLAVSQSRSLAVSQSRSLAVSQSR